MNTIEIEMSKDLRSFCESMQELIDGAERLLSQDRISDGDLNDYLFKTRMNKNQIITIAERKKHYQPLLILFYEKENEFGKQIREKYQRDNSEENLR